MTTSSDPDEIRAEIERTRAQLSSNVDALTDTANPKNIANRQVNKVKGAFRGVKEHIMGPSDDPYDEGRLGDAKAAVSDRVTGVQDRVAGIGDAVSERASAVGDAVSDRASAVGDAVSNAPTLARQKTQGNPLAAGLIAFGAGLLVSGLIPSSQREQQAVSTLQDKGLEPLKEKATEVAKDMADNLREPAQEAAESLKSTATDAVQAVKEEGTAAKDQVTSQAQQSKETVQQEYNS